MPRTTTTAQQQPAAAQQDEHQGPDLGALLAAALESLSTPSSARRQPRSLPTISQWPHRLAELEQLGALPLMVCRDHYRRIGSTGRPSVVKQRATAANAAAAVVIALVDAGQMTASIAHDLAIKAGHVAQSAANESGKTYRPVDLERIMLTASKMKGKSVRVYDDGRITFGDDRPEKGPGAAFKPVAEPMQ
jgi:hypothetical protein